ncbi:hypothetical protein Ami103574_04710 [Aminipila butyrica]|uniref:SGNH hydrolase-type esterase domain-containing protein n=1 Tax=Aminipila butyrica TaxID=433296 RepID=A0A858BRX9_9FIRM|nr:GDSL-type esterase/lipase family protein [Aminipila butyrica]QIB68663.1 hypothetical protein Ami103574_04710 [Aminipila butyrica]
MKIVFIGNSIINGFPYDREQDFVGLYRKASGQEVLNKGVNGDTVQGVTSRFAQDVLAQRPDMVVILLGTNEFIYQESLPETCMKQIAYLAELAAAHGIQPVLLTPLPVDPLMAESRWMVCDDVDYELVQEQIEQLRKQMVDYGKQHEIKVLDTYRAYQEYADQIGAQAAYYDGIHPTREGHQFLAEIVGKLL